MTKASPTPLPDKQPPEQITDMVVAVEQLPAWIAQHWLSIAVAAGIGVAIYLVLALIRGQAVRLCRKGEAGSHWAAVLGLTLRKTGHIFMVLVAARLVAGYANPPAALLTTVQFLFTISAVFQVAIWVRAAILAYVDQRTQGDDGSETLTNASGLIRVLVTAALFFIALIVVLDNLGVNVTGLVAGLGIGGIAIGLAAQGIFSDLFASLSIIFDQPFRVGETIDFGKGPAVVERIGLKSTRLRAVTGERLIVSNAQLLGKELTSLTGLHRRRFSFAIGLVYQTSPEAAEKLPDAARDVIESAHGHFVRAGFIAFGASSLDFEVVFDVIGEDLEMASVVRHRIGLALFARLAELGYALAYPTQTTFTADPDGRMIMPYPMPAGGPAKS